MEKNRKSYIQVIYPTSLVERHIYIYISIEGGGFACLNNESRTYLHTAYLYGTPLSYPFSLEVL